MLTKISCLTIALTGWLWTTVLPKNTDFPDRQPAVSEALFQCDNGKVHIRSEAPLELIEAQSNKMRGALDPANNSFAWTVEIKTLEGFNSPLQREHFNENYMESQKFPKASFSGKLIEKIDFEQDGVHDVRAKGKFSVHGIERERIIKSRLELKNGRITIHSEFTVLLADHDITIPRIVHQKIAEEVKVTVDAVLK